MEKLNVSRRQDRLVMAGDIRALVKGPHWTYEDEELPDTRELWVKLKGPRGLSITIDLDGDQRQQRQGCFVLSWHGVREPHKLAPGFAPSVNPFHWHKATDVCDSFQELLQVLRIRMAAAVDGSAFQLAWYVDCGSCGSYHPDGFAGDCRDDANRFTCEALDKLHGGRRGWDFKLDKAS